ncbi:MAG TPA: hypothetical protein VIX84_01640 [Acidimicrobiales bacterium]
MIALVVVSTFAVLLLGILVAGLLRSHADILRSLHELGVGIGDPVPATHSDAAPLEMSRPARHEGSHGAPDIAGLTPSGDARAVAMANRGGRTLLAFLSSGCATCAGFWRDLQAPGRLELGEVRIVIVTKGPDMEISAEVRTLSTGRVPVVMSTEAWSDYLVPASPFFVLVDGTTGQRIGHGVAANAAQLTDLVKRAAQDISGHDTHLDGPAREAANDALLVSAGITPGHRSLYPQSFRDVFPFADTVTDTDVDEQSITQHERRARKPR